MLCDNKKTKQQLIEELVALRRRVSGISEDNKDKCSLSDFEMDSWSLLQNAPFVAIKWNLDFEVVEWNLAAESVFGYTKSEALGRHAVGLIVPESVREQVNKIWDDLLKNSGGFFSRNENSTKDGRKVICDWSNTTLVDKSGKVIGVVSLVHDITDTTKTQEALIESENKYRTLFEKSADAILIIEGDQFVDCNSATVAMLGYESREELLETHPSELSPEKQPDGQSSFEKANEFMSIAFSRGSHRFEWEHVKHDGTVFPVEVLLTAVPSHGKNFLHVVWRDITERKRLEGLESRAARLDTAGTIAGQVAHDFNNLLGPLVAYPDLIRMKLPKDHPTLKYLARIESSAKKIADINQQLLSLGRRGHYNMEVFDLNDVVQQAINGMPPLADNITCSTELQADIMKTLGGSSQVHRVITNLLCNAVDALHVGGSIRVRTENYYADEVSGVYGRVPKGEYVKLTVSDTGCGISDEIVQKILDPFFTTKASDKVRGSGLGLSVVDAVLKDHGGYLDLVTKVGEGASFYLYFPVTRNKLITDSTEKIIGGNESVLVIDDDEMQRDVSTNLLRGLGYRVSVAESGESALEFLKENPHDLLVLDMVMPPGIDGTETYRRILEFYPNQKAILASGFSESDRVSEAQALGAGAFVKKPLTRRALAAAVRRELDRRVEQEATAH